MKIKQKKQLNLPQLIEGGFENPELAKGRAYNIDDENVRFAPYVSFLADGTGVRVPCTITQDNTFTIEVEEELTEDTFFKHLIKVTEDGEHYSTDFFKVRDLIHLGTEEIHAYIDGEYKLIWTHEKGLVE